MCVFLFLLFLSSSLLCVCFLFLYLFLVLVVLSFCRCVCVPHHIHPRTDIGLGVEGMQVLAPLSPKELTTLYLYGELPCRLDKYVYVAVTASPTSSSSSVVISFPSSSFSPHRLLTKKITLSLSLPRRQRPRRCLRLGVPSSPSSLPRYPRERPQDFWR